MSKEKESNHRYPPVAEAVWSEQKQSSVGIPAIFSSLRHMGRYMDMPEALKASLKMNQKDGFAWRVL